MAKVLGIREIMLNSGVSEPDFERFVVDECYPAWRDLPVGWRLSVLKGDRGDRVGKYLHVFEFESVEARDRHVPGPGKPMSEQIQRWFEAHGTLSEKWNTFATPLLGVVWTDYVEVVK